MSTSRWKKTKLSFAKTIGGSRNHFDHGDIPCNLHHSLLGVRMPDTRIGLIASLTCAGKIQDLDMAEPLDPSLSSVEQQLVTALSLAINREMTATKRAYNLGMESGKVVARLISRC